MAEFEKIEQDKRKKLPRMVLFTVTLIFLALFLMAGDRTGLTYYLTATIDPRTATIESLLTQASAAQTKAANPQGTNTPALDGPTVDPRTATVEGLLTQAALAQTQAAKSLQQATLTETQAALEETQSTNLRTQSANFQTQAVIKKTQNAENPREDKDKDKDERRDKSAEPNIWDNDALLPILIVGTVLLIGLIIGLALYRRKQLNK